MPLKDHGDERERQAKKSRDKYLQVSAVDLPARKLPELFEACRHDLLKFLQDVFPGSTGLKPFGAGQVQAIKLMEHAALHGGRVAQAFPRGFAKTSISARAAIWCVMYGHRSYVPVLTAAEENSKNIIDGIKTELEENEILLGMFPELACIRALEGKSQRTHSQHIDGKLTHMRWTADRVVMPTLEGVVSSGCVLQAKAMRSVRGLQYTRPDGQIIRPDFVILDDIQTDEDARSPAVVSKIVNKVRTSVLRAGGHMRTLAAIMNATVIQPDDVAEYFLGATGWQSVRYKMVLEFPERMDLWEGPYRDLLLDYDRNDAAGMHQARKHALAFYEANREDMDRGAQCAWDWCYEWDDDDPVEVSAIQHAMNILLVDGPEVFNPECQNEPIRLTDGLLLTPEVVMGKRVPIKQVPQEATNLVAHIDVQGNMLIYTVGAFSQDYTGGIVSIGAWPEQRDAYYNQTTTKHDFNSVWPGMDPSAQLYQALEYLVPRLLAHRWVREDGLELQVSKVLIDESYRKSTVHLFCRQSGFGAIVMPARGKYYGPNQQGIDEAKWEPKSGEARGNMWEIRKSADGAGLSVVFDTNHWKSFVWERFGLPIGAPTSWRIIDLPTKRVQMLADQVCSEFPELLESHSSGRKKYVWNLLPGRRDNHYFDNCVGLAVAANMLGTRLPGADGEVKQKKKIRRRVKFERKPRRVSPVWLPPS